MYLLFFTHNYVRSFNNMFNFLKNKNNKKILSPSEGYLMDLKTSKDEIFSQKTLGDGFYIKMRDSKVYAPISGTIESIFPTNHAYCIKGKNGEEILIHIGINTNGLKSGVIESTYRVKDSISHGDLLAELDLLEFKRLGIEAEVYVFMLNNLTIKNDYRNDKVYVYDGDCILEIEEVQN